jgi:hypothetical protein
MLSRYQELALNLKIEYLLKRKKNGQQKSLVTDESLSKHFEFNQEMENVKFHFLSRE